MEKIVLIACASKKSGKKAKAKDIYISPLFKLNLNYALSLNPKKIFILSAKHYLLNPEDEIEPYNQTLNSMTKEEKREWADKILEQLKQQQLNLDKDEFIFLAGENYRKFLIPYMPNYEIPFKGLGIGKQLKALKEKLEDRKDESNEQKCEDLHNIFNNMKRFTFPFNQTEIPKNGIYILFEQGEKAHGNKDRIVRIGTHTGKNQLPSRLQQHFINENKDRSIFRKNIGRALLNKQNDPFLQQWEIDLTTKQAREENQDSIDLEKQKQIEKQVTEYIQKNFTFVVLPIKNKEKRLETESKIISTVSLCKHCIPSKSWIGFFSPKEKIKQSGLWLVNELYKQPLSEGDIKELKEVIGKLKDE